MSFSSITRHITLDFNFINKKKVDMQISHITPQRYRPLADTG